MSNLSICGHGVLNRMKHLKGFFRSEVNISGKEAKIVHMNDKLVYIFQDGSLKKEVLESVFGEGNKITPK